MQTERARDRGLGCGAVSVSGTREERFRAAAGLCENSVHGFHLAPRTEEKIRKATTYPLALSCIEGLLKGFHTIWPFGMTEGNGSVISNNARDYSAHRMAGGCSGHPLRPGRGAYGKKEPLHGGKKSGDALTADAHNRSGRRISQLRRGPWESKRPERAHSANQSTKTICRSITLVKVGPVINKSPRGRKK